MDKYSIKRIIFGFERFCSGIFENIIVIGSREKYFNIFSKTDQPEKLKFVLKYHQVEWIQDVKIMIQGCRMGQQWGEVEFYI